MKFKDFQVPVLFSSTFKALNLAEKNSRTFKDAWEPFLYFAMSAKAGLHDPRQIQWQTTTGKVIQKQCQE